MQVRSRCRRLSYRPRQRSAVVVVVVVVEICIRSPSNRGAHSSRTSGGWLVASQNTAIFAGPLSIRLLTRTSMRARRLLIPVGVLACVTFSNPHQLLGQAKPAATGGSVTTTQVAPSRCGELAELAPVSAAKSVWLEEVDASNKRYLVRGDTLQFGRSIISDKRSQSGWPEVDPRSTLVVHFGDSDRCAPPCETRHPTWPGSRRCRSPAARRRPA